MKVNKKSLSYFRTAPFPSQIDRKTGKRKKIPPNRNPFIGENLLSIQFANYLREITLTGKCRATWTKIAHETSSKSQAYGNLMRNMGKMAGVADFIFTCNGKSLWLELKNGNAGKLSPDQEFFQTWCQETGSPYEIAFSLKEAIKIVEKYGFVRA